MQCSWNRCKKLPKVGSAPPPRLCDFRGQKNWTPLFCGSSTPKQPKSAKKSDLAFKSYGRTCDTLLYTPLNNKDLPSNTSSLSNNGGILAHRWPDTLGHQLVQSMTIIQTFNHQWATVGLHWAISECHSRDRDTGDTSEPLGQRALYTGWGRIPERSLKDLKTPSITTKVTLWV